MDLGPICTYKKQKKIDIAYASLDRIFLYHLTLWLDFFR